MDVTVVIVSYRVPELLARCLASIRDTTTARAVRSVVVDNASGDGTVEQIQRNFPQVTVIANEENRGFSIASNQATAAAESEAILFLNPDTELQPHALDEMLDFLESHPDVGVIGPRLVYPDGQTQPSRRRDPTLLIALVESTLIQRWWPRCPVLAHYYAGDQSEGETQQVDWLVGACLLIRRAALRKAGGFDERFFMYSEEMDLCRRIRENGWRVVYLPSARVTHHEGRSSEQNLARRARTFNESKCRYFEKYLGASVGRALRLFLLANTLTDLLIEGLKLAIGHRRELRATRVRNLVDVARFQLNHLGSEARCSIRWATDNARNPD